MKILLFQSFVLIVMMKYLNIEMIYVLAEASRRNSEITDAENSEGSEIDSSLDSSPDTNSISQMSVTFRNNENAQKNYASPSEVIERLEKVEGQVPQILQRIENNEEKILKMKKQHV